MNTTPSSTPRISPTTSPDGIAVTRTQRHGNWPMLDEHVDATRQAGKSSERALVLAGGERQAMRGSSVSSPACPMRGSM